MPQALANNVFLYPRGTGKAQNIILWVLQIAASLMFLGAGISKVLGAEQMVEVFNATGLGQWFRYVTGGLEIIGALALLTPTFAGLGALMLIGVMSGAIATHLFVIGGSPALATVLLVVVTVIAWGRRDRTLRLIVPRSLSGGSKL